MAAAIEYPSALPGPTNGSYVAAERRKLALPFAARDFSRDRSAKQSVRFVFNAAQAASFKSWYDDTIEHGGSWFASSWPLPYGGVGVRRFESPPKWVFLGNGFWEVTADLEVRGAGELPIDFGDPFYDNVISLLDFHEDVAIGAYAGSSPSHATADVTEDYKGIAWRIHGYNHAQTPYIGVRDGYLHLPEYQADEGFSCGVMESEVNARFAGEEGDDFTIELTHNTITGHTAPWTSGGGQIFMIVSATHSTNGVSDFGDWAFGCVNGSAVFNISVSDPVLGSVVRGVTFLSGFDSFGLFAQDVEWALARSQGRLLMFRNGELVATQPGTQAADGTPLQTQVTFGGQGVGSYLLPNNYGFGRFKRWRYTMGHARYTADYTPTGMPFPTRRAG